MLDYQRYVGTRETSLKGRTTCTRHGSASTWREPLDADPAYVLLTWGKCFSFFMYPLPIPYRYLPTVPTSKVLVRAFTDSLKQSSTYVGLGLAGAP
jgi:hypothetical protein